MGWMYLFNVVGPVGLFLAGVLALKEVILARKPEAREALEKLTAQLGWLGAAMIMGGVSMVLYDIRWISGIGVDPVGYLIRLIGAFLLALNGLEFGWSQFASWFSFIGKKNIDCLASVKDKLKGHSKAFGGVSILFAVLWIFV